MNLCRSYLECLESSWRCQIVSSVESGPGLCTQLISLSRLQTFKQIVHNQRNISAKVKAGMIWNELGVMIVVVVYGWSHLSNQTWLFSKLVFFSQEKFPTHQWKIGWKTKNHGKLQLREQNGLQKFNEEAGMKSTSDNNAAHRRLLCTWQPSVVRGISRHPTYSKLAGDK